MILKEIDATRNQLGNPQVSEVCEKITIVYVNDQKEEIKSNQPKKKVTDIDLSSVLKKYLSRDTVLTI